MLHTLLLVEAAGTGLLLGLLVLAPSDARERALFRLRAVGRRSRPAPERRESDDFRQRVLAPLVESASQRLTRLLPLQQQAALRARLERAGAPTTPGLLFGARILLALLGLLAAAFGPRALPLALALALLGWRLPDFWLSRRIAAQQQAFGRALPDVLDLLSVSVEAGLGIDGALSRVAERFAPPTSTEFGRALREMRLGRPRAQALQALSARIALPELEAFVAALVQADELGVGLTRVLRVQSERMRTLRRQRAQEKAMKMPIKMLFPLVFFIFPAIFAVLLGPALISMLQLFHH